jgi:hypothetical protein
VTLPAAAWNPVMDLISEGPIKTTWQIFDAMMGQLHAAASAPEAAPEAASAEADNG